MTLGSPNGRHTFHLASLQHVHHTRVLHLVRQEANLVKFFRTDQNSIHGVEWSLGMRLVSSHLHDSLHVVLDELILHDLVSGMGREPPS